MNRVIKFRCWTGQEMVDDCLSLKFNPASNFDGLDMPSYYTPSFSMCSMREVMQFTGLTDKNGVEIYEGDIVSVSGTGNAEVKICPAYGVVFSDKDGYERPYVDCVAEQDYPIVIGNIYQNPELLK